MKPKNTSIEPYDQENKKPANKPPVGLVPPETNPDAGRKKTFQYDPHLVEADQARVSGPFTVEVVPAVCSIAEAGRIVEVGA